MIDKELEQSYIPLQCMIINNFNQFRLEGVPTAQYEILEILNSQGGKTTKELAELRGISQSGISKLTKVLLDKGYIRQERSRLDRRYFSNLITECGRDFLVTAEKFRTNTMLQIQAALTKEELHQFSYLCSKIISFR